jgi:hypothetical protein
MGVGPPDDVTAANKFAGMSPPALNNQPAEASWFEKDRDPNGI